MEKRTLSPPEFEFLSEESKLWEAEKLISPEIRRNILASYSENGPSLEESRTHSETDRLQNLFFTALVSLGTLLLGVAALLLVTYNWQKLPPVGKFSIIGGTMAAAYLTAGGLAWVKKYVYSEIAMFFGTFLYGIGIWQISQVFHVAAYEPAGLMFWALGTFALALFMRTPLLHFLAAALLGFWCTYEILYFPFFWSFGSFGHSVSQSFFFGLSSIVPLVAWLGWFSAPRRERSERAAECIRFSYMILFWTWLALIDQQLHFLGYFSHTAAYFLMFGAAMLLVSQFRVTQRLSVKLLGTVGAFFTGLALLPGSYVRFYTHGPAQFAPNEIVVFLLVFTACALIYLLGISWRFRLWTRWRDSWFFLILLLWGTATGVYCENTITTPLIQNVLMVLFSVVMMYFGIRRNRMHTFLFGVLYFLLWMILRYTDLFGDFGGMPGAALMFFLCAVFFFGLSYVWFKMNKFYTIKGGSNDEIQ